MVAIVLWSAVLETHPFLATTRTLIDPIHIHWDIHRRKWVNSLFMLLYCPKRGENKKQKVLVTARPKTQQADRRVVEGGGKKVDGDNGTFNFQIDCDLVVIRHQRQQASNSRCNCWNGK
jgi:hypothetical protein